MKVRPNHIGVEDECIKIYNPAKQELLKTFDTYGQASKYLGINDRVLRGAARSKKRKYSPFLNMEIAIRVKKKTEEDRAVIKKTIKHSAG